MSYYALISSLPMLLLDGNAEFTTERFYSYCENYLKEENLQILKDLDLDPVLGRFKADSLPGRYAAWECALRNAIVKIRARKLDCEAAEFHVPDHSHCKNYL